MPQTTKTTNGGTTFIVHKMCNATLQESDRNSCHSLNIYISYAAHWDQIDFEVACLKSKFPCSFINFIKKYIENLSKVGLISETFSLWLTSPKMGAKSLP